MSLDLSKVLPQVGNMIAQLKTGEQGRRQRLQSALDTFSNNADFDKLKRKVQQARGKTSWLLAGLVDRLNGAYPPLPLPADFTVIATDGSQIDVDRHRTARCFLINIGAVTLHYGKQPDAALESYPHLHASEEELVIAPPDGKGRAQMIEGNLLGIVRGVEECRRLAKMAGELAYDGPTLALLDGSLIMWTLEPYPDFVTSNLLDNGFLKCLEEMRQLNARRPTAFASYISYPRSTDVVNTLRIALCPHELVDCERNCANNAERACDAVAGVRDSDLFADVLKYGERSSIFANQSSVVEKRYGLHRIYFFYLKTENEIARIEVPEWVACHPELLDLTHTLVLDQCRRGHGYPVVLSETHEQAVVTGADREQFWDLVESLMIDERMPSNFSAKSFTKRVRWI